MSDETRLHIDDDWKASAQREKEALAKEVESGQPGGEGPLPEASFPAIINTLAMQAVVGLGGYGGPGGQQIPPNPETAKLFIDMLDVLDQKTKGNLTPEEKKLLDTTLYSLRMAYLEMMGGGVGGPAGSRGAGPGGGAGIAR
jgi:hypothetical protein